MGVGGADNPLWLDVLEWGPDAAHAGWFDIEWDPQRRYLHNKLLVPLLGDHYGIELERGVLRAASYDDQEGSFAVWAYDTHKLPIWPPHYAAHSRQRHPRRSSGWRMPSPGCRPGACRWRGAPPNSRRSWRDLVRRARADRARGPAIARWRASRAAPGELDRLAANCMP